MDSEKEGRGWMMRTALVWDITQRVVVNPYRRFGITHRSRNAGRELPLLGFIDP